MSTSGEARRPNRLAAEASPYLLQHAHNPVDWYPWGEEALARARREDRPILLSIGYAACHWCHVMERESFEDGETAALMNEHFVCVKVDREERPDLDAIYMDAVQAMTGSGGWPMTVFCIPDGTPFYAGTYFPKDDRFGMPAFRKVLAAVAGVWRDRREAVRRQGEQVLRAISAAAAAEPSAEPLDADLLREARSALEATFDPEWGGFGAAPKFPQAMTLEFLLRAHLRGLQGALPMLSTTLERMAAGGIHDRVGGGFHRYSVDGRWHVPHFEKMLYDNALLARLYARAWQVGGDPRLAETARRTCEFVLDELRDPGGGFRSSIDADSEGGEGTFYVWGWDELVAAVGEEVARYLGAAPNGNWEGANVLWVPDPRVPPPADLDAGLGRLADRRRGRRRPATDDKVVAAWNGLAISSLAEAGRALGDERLIAAAAAGAEFVLGNLVRADGRLLRSWRGGRAGPPGFADDHAMMAEACLTLYQTTFELRWFEQARRLADELVRLFHDPERGGFFQVGRDAEALVVRAKELYDNAVPSANAAAADVLLRLSLLTGEAGYEAAAVSALRLVRDAMRHAPSGFGHALCALDLYLGPAREVAIVGDPADRRTAGLRHEVHRRFLPGIVLAGAAPGDDLAAATVPLLAGRTAIDGRPTAYVCERFACRFPVSDPAGLAAQLQG